MIARDFYEDLAMSDQPETVVAIKSACHEYFPEILNIIRAHKVNDLLGADYWLEFPNCKMETLDVKVRKLDYSLHGDNRIACLEIVANINTKKIGWTLDTTKNTDWIMFYYQETGKSFFYNMRLLRAAVLSELENLRKLGKNSIQKTKSGHGFYESESLFVSHRELGAAIYRHCQKLPILLKVA